MDNGQQYHHSGPPVRPEMDFRSQRPPPLTSAQHHQHNYIPCSSFQSQEPPPVCNAFQGYNWTEAAAFNQPSTPSSAFHSYRFPPPDLSHPPPSLVVSRGSDLFSSDTEMHPRNRMPLHQQHFRSSSSHGQCSYPLTPPTFRDPFSHNTMESSNPQSTSGELATYENAIELNKDDEQMWLRNFEQRIMERSKQHYEKVTTKKKPLKLLEVQQMISQSRILTEKLHHLKEKMTLLRNDTQDQVWWELLDQAENIKFELAGITQKFQDNLFMENVCQLIHQRKKKRENKKKRHKLKTKQNKELKILWKKEEEKIDAWREKLQLKEEEKRREIAVKTEADIILGEVRQKQADGIKMQQLLESLISLRIVRLNKGAAHGFISTPQRDQLFTTTLNNITEVVKAQMEEYKLEEQTLCVMMEESTSYQRTNAGKEPRDAINKLETLMKKVLFGDVAPIDQETFQDFTAADYSLEALLQRRKEWDQFICEEDIPLGSSVPPSWVVPPTQPTASWNNLQG